MVGSSGLEIRSGVQGHKPAWLNFEHKDLQTRKCGLANSRGFLMRPGNDWKVTPGITELSRPRVHSSTQIYLCISGYIDGAVCYFDVGSSYPGGAEAAKGGGVHPLKGFVSWVQYAVRQYVWYLLGMFDVWKEGSFSTRGTKVRGPWWTGYLTR